MRIVFMGTPDLAKEALQALYEAGHSILGVVTNPDRPKGRGMKLAISPVKEYALENHLTIYQPEKVKNNVEFIKTIQVLQPEMICAVAYGKILPKEILDIPEKGCVNLHFSLLPNYRGAAPINWPILNGDTKTGVTTIYMDEGMDSGDIILQKEVPILQEETAGELWEKLSHIGANLLVETMSQIEQGIAPRIKQPQNYTLAPMLSKEMSQIEWKKMDANTIQNLIRGLSPIMGAYTIYQGKKIKLWKIEIVEDETITNTKQEPGTILVSNSKQGLYIQTLDKVIKVLEIQGENARRMEITEFLRGNVLKEGSIF